MEQTINNIKQQLAEAIDQKQALKIVGGDSKSFLGRVINGSPLCMAEYSGIIKYEPTELFITVKAGTLLSEINSALAAQGQMLAFEPAEINANTTIGGVVATGLSGPRRAYSGAVRDYVLGIRCINGLGKELRFGGEVMKNVAGYDLSRLMTGAYGTLGIILEVSLKVVPMPEFEMTYCIDMTLEKALEKMRDLSVKATPVSATCYDGKQLFIRLSGNKSTIAESAKRLGFDEYAQGDSFWRELRDYKASIFNTDKPIWRLSVPNTSTLELNDDTFLIEWGGGLYWLHSEREPKDIYDLASRAGGHAMLFNGGDRTKEIFQPLEEGLFNLHKGLKKAFDPYSILNPEKMYAMF